MLGRKPFFEKDQFNYYNFTGTKWDCIQKEENILYLKNAYREGTRLGFVIFIPNGDNSDKTMLKDYYDGTYEYFRKIGIEEI